MSPCRLLTAAQPTDRDRPGHEGHISNAVCNLTHFPTPPLFLHHFSPSGALVPPLPPEAVEQRRCIILIRNMRNEKSLKTQVKAHFKMHFFLLLSFLLPALFVFVNFGTLRRTWGVERGPPLLEEDRLEEGFLSGAQSIVLPAPTNY